MSDAVERLLEVEAKAREIIAQARSEAAATVERARGEAQQLLADSCRRAQADANDLVRREQDQAEQERQAALRSAECETPQPQDADQQKLTEAVRRIVKVIAWGDGDGQS